MFIASLFKYSRSPRQDCDADAEDCDCGPEGSCLTCFSGGGGESYSVTSSERFRASASLSAQVRPPVTSTSPLSHSTASLSGESGLEPMRLCATIIDSYLAPPRSSEITSSVGASKFNFVPGVPLGASLPAHFVDSPGLRTAVTCSHSLLPTSRTAMVASVQLGRAGGAANRTTSVLGPMGSCHRRRGAAERLLHLGGAVRLEVR
eukprot:scaffold116878_cov63-Phaeocystis_antarctica.AAC.3